MIKRILKLPPTHSFFLFGPRQTGKSTLIDICFKEHVWKINLLLNDDYFLYAKDPSRFRKEAIEKIEKEKIKTIFIDEVQRIPALLNEVQFLMQNYKCQFILTGSSARKLKRGGANLLAGRAIEYHLYPFVYEEIKNAARLSDILHFGTLPPVFTAGANLRNAILETYVNTYLKEEIQQEGIARNIGGFSNFLDLAAGNFSEIVNYSNISRECRLPVRTVQSYYDILEDTLIGYRLPGWDKSVRKRLSSHPKFYFFDNGITNAINKYLTGTLDRQYMGRLFEQWIITQTLAFIRYNKVESNLYYWRTNHGAEVDLLIEKHGKITAAIEIKLSENITGAHVSGIKSLKEEYPKTPCFLICSAKNAFTLHNIRILPWQKYLEELKVIVE